MICDKCNSNNSISNKYCNKCGSILNKPLWFYALLFNRVGLLFLIPILINITIIYMIFLDFISLSIGILSIILITIFFSLLFYLFIKFIKKHEESD